MKKILTALAISMTMAVGASAGTGVFGSYVGLDANGGGNSWYGTLEWGTDIQNFNTALGTFNWFTGDTLAISNFQVQSWKSDGGDVTGVKFNYRVYKTGDTPGGFTELSGGWLSDSPFTGPQGSLAEGGGDQNWGSTLNINLLSGISDITSTNYTVEVFAYVTTNEGSQYANNGGSNYKATFNAVPEPATAVSVLGGLLTLMMARRRRA